MKTIQLLENNDPVEPNDWMRPLHIISMSGGHSDYYDFSPTNNNAKWQRVKYCLGKPWHYRTVKEINVAMRKFNHYEFVRGDITVTHRETVRGLWDHSRDCDDEIDEIDDQ